MSTTSQAQVRFEGKAIVETKAERDQLNKIFTTYELFSLDAEAINDHIKATPTRSLFTLSMGDSKVWSIELEENEMRSPQYVAYRTGESGSVELPRTECVTFEGSLANQPKHQVRLNVEPNRIWGFIEEPDGTYYIEPLVNFVELATSDKFVVYKSTSVIADNLGECGASSVQEEAKNIDQIGSPKSAGSDCRKLEIATESDFELVELGVSFNDILGNLNMVEAIYEADFDMKFIVVFQNEWEISADPYSAFVSGCGSFGQLSEFVSEWSDNRSEVRRDINILYTGKDYAGTAVGCAQTSRFGNGLDNDLDAYCVNQWTNNSLFSIAAARVTIVAHEMGHVFGAQHDDSNCGTFQGKNIMCPFITTSTTFLSTAIDEIEAGLTHESAASNDGRSAIRQRYYGELDLPGTIEIEFLDPVVYSANEWLLDKAMASQSSSQSLPAFTATDISKLKPGFNFNADFSGSLKINIGTCDIDGD